MKTNNLFNQLNENPPTYPDQQPRNIIEELSDFARNFKGDPKEQVMNILKNNGISQQDYNNAIEQTNILYNMLRK